MSKNEQIDLGQYLSSKTSSQSGWALLRQPPPPRSIDHGLSTPGHLLGYKQIIWEIKAMHYMLASSRQPKCKP